MGFAYSQLKDFEHAKDSFSQAIQAAINTNDKRSHWQASEGLAAVHFLQGNYKHAVQNYKTALGALSASGEMNTEHNERIVNKLADAMKFQLTQGKSNNIQRNSSYRRSKATKTSPGISKEEVDRGKLHGKIGKTRSRKENHRLIAHGIDGEEEKEESDSSSSDSSNTLSSSSSSSSESKEKGGKGRHISPSWEKKKKEQRPKKNTLNKSKPELLLSGPYQKLISNRNKSSDESDNGAYEEPVDDKQVPAKERSHRADHSKDMPRAHREAYLASIASNSSPERSTEDKKVMFNESQKTTQSKTCVIQ
jgi:tetratricopeptide (TPR) repeat protein